jgi:hypothetical protein
MRKAHNAPCIGSIQNFLLSAENIPYSSFYCFSWEFTNTMSGQAASYYNPNEGFAGEPQDGPPGSSKKTNGVNNDYQNGGQPSGEPKPPPPYGQGQYPQDQPPPYTEFDEAFKVERPKYNDIWAGLLVSELCHNIKSKLIEIPVDCRVPRICRSLRPDYPQVRDQ